MYSKFTPLIKFQNTHHSLSNTEHRIWIPLSIHSLTHSLTHLFTHSLTHSLTYALACPQALDESVDSTVPPVPMLDAGNPSTPYKPRTPHTPYTPNNPRTPSSFRPDTGGSWQSYASYQSDLSHGRMSTPGVKTPKPPPIALDRFVGTRAEEVIGVLTAIHIQEMARVSSPAGFFEDE